MREAQSVSAIFQKKTMKYRAQTGSFKCGKKRCLCCNQIAHGATTFKALRTSEQFDIKQYLSCDSEYVICLLNCRCGLHYIGGTIQTLRSRMNTHRANVSKNSQFHSVSRHCSCKHKNDPSPYSIVPIDQIPEGTNNRFEALKRKEMFWIYKMETC